MRKEILGGLTARITGGTDGSGGGEGPVVVLMHGFGAPGDDLVPLWRFLQAPSGTRFIFPEAPLSLSMLGFGEARAWWMIDLARLEGALAGGTSPSVLAREIPAGLVEAREKVFSLLEEVERRFAPSRLVLGGFSQGAMLACDVALRARNPPAGLLFFSGAIIAEEEWLSLLPERRDLAVLLSHGSADPLLPISEARRLYSLLNGFGLAVEWVEFPGGHEIPPLVLEKAGEFLRKIL